MRCFGHMQDTVLYFWDVHHCALHARSDPRKDLLFVTADGATSVPTQRRGLQL